MLKQKIIFIIQYDLYDKVAVKFLIGVRSNTEDIAVMYMVQLVGSLLITSF